VNFDKYFLGFDPEADALEITSFAINSNLLRFDTQQYLNEHPNWSQRRMNNALSFLANESLVNPHKSMRSGEYNFDSFNVTDRTLRFVRENQ
jgi:hypothetical protein